jgi:hypothetical protein
VAVDVCVAVYSAPSSIAQPFDQLSSEAYGADDGGQPVDFAFPAVPGTTYWIAVDGISIERHCTPAGQCFYDTPTGPFVLSIG